ncbi:MAG: HAMP domain-containing sensor histidine kinase [Polyangiales bacterium]
MTAEARRPTAYTRRHVISVIVVVTSCALTAAMSLVFNGMVRPEMMLTGFVCAVVCDRFVQRVTAHYRRRLREAYELLEQRVRERTAELEQANHTLMISDRMAQAGKLAAGISHEIRTPLQVISMVGGELEEYGSEIHGEELRERIGDINHAARRITTIIRDLSSLAKPIDDPIAAVALDSVVASAARLAGYQLGEGVKLELGDLRAPHVVGNESRLVQVALNLFTNAARATRTGARNTIVVSTAARDAEVQLVISDTGTGMTDATRARLFEPFFTTGAERGGTGLGLMICKTLVERMGGTIDIASTFGEGTTVTVTLRAASSTTVVAPLARTERLAS